MAITKQNNNHPVATGFLYLTACLAFFSGWFFIAADYSWLRQNFVWVMRLNTPVADLFGAVMVIVFGLGIIHHFIFSRGKIAHGQIWQNIVPSELRSYLLFLLSAAVSVYFIYDREYVSSLWHWLRYIVFSFSAFLVIPYYLIDDKKTLKNILYVWFGVGLFTAVYGLSSLIVHDFWAEWTRVRPFSIWGWNPFGANHNQLAEALVVILPIAVFFTISAYRKNDKLFKFFLVSTTAMAFTCLLTLSRAAWICLAVQALFALGFSRQKLREWMKERKISLFVFMVMGAAVVIYMLYFLVASNIIQSSNSARLETTKIIFYNLQDAPFFGFGPGSYMKILWNTKSYVMDFGEPLEAHGFLQKILIEEGFVGFAFFVLFLIFFFLHLWNAGQMTGYDRLLMRALFLSSFGIVIFQLFNTEYFSATMWMPMGVALAAAKLRA